MSTDKLEHVSDAGLPNAIGAVRQPDVSCIKVDGRCLRVARWKGKSESSRPLLFFSGIGSNLEILAPFMERLTGRDVVTFDMPGIGGSAKSGGAYRMSTIAATSTRIMDVLGYAQFDVMGVSWGGMVAQQIAHRYPDRIGRLVLAATSAGVLMVPGRLTALAMMLNLRRFKDAGFLRRHFDTLYGGGDCGWQKYAQGVQAPSATGYLYQLGALVGWTSAAFLHEITSETLILGGTDDSLVRPVNLRFLNDLLPKARLHFIKGAGHMLLLSHLREAACLVEAFLEGADLEPATEIS